MDFIESAMLHDRATPDSMTSQIHVLIAGMRNIGTFEKASNDELVEEIRQYDDERQAQKLRKCSYREEMRRTRTDYGAL